MIVYYIWLVDYITISVSSRIAEAFSIQVIDLCRPPLVSITPSTAGMDDVTYRLLQGVERFSFSPFVPSSLWCVVSYSFTTSNSAIDSAISMDTSTGQLIFTVLPTPSNDFEDMMENSIDNLDYTITV